MARIWIAVAKWHDWDVTDVAPTEEQVQQGVARQNSQGDWTKRVSRDEPSETYISIPESEVQELMDAYAANPEVLWGAESREEVVAQLVSRLVMPKHAHRSDWTGVRTDDPELTDYLCRVFNLPEAVVTEPEEVQQ